MQVEKETYCLKRKSSCCNIAAPVCPPFLLHCVLASMQPHTVTSHKKETKLNERRRKPVNRADAQESTRLCTTSRIQRLHSLCFPLEFQPYSESLWSGAALPPSTLTNELVLHKEWRVFVMSTLPLCFLRCASFFVHLPAVPAHRSEISIIKNATSRNPPTPATCHS